MTAVERETIQSVEMLRESKEAVRIAQQIQANVAEYWDGNMGYEAFDARAKLLWDEAKSRGVVGEVTAIVCPRL